MNSLLIARAVALRRAAALVRVSALDCVPPGGSLLSRPATLAGGVNVLGRAQQQERYYASHHDGNYKGKGSGKRGSPGQFKSKKKPVQSMYPTPESIPPWLAIPHDAEDPLVAASNKSTTSTEAVNDGEDGDGDTSPNTVEPVMDEATLEINKQLLTTPLNEAWFYYVDLPQATQQQIPTYTVNQFLARLKREGDVDALQRMYQVVTEAEVNKNVDISTYNTLLHTAIREGKSVETQKILARIDSANIKWNTVTYNVLIYGYTRSNMHREAKVYFEKLRSQEDDIYPDAYTYTTMIASYCRRGMIADAENLITEMQTDGFPVTVYLEEIMLRGYALANRIKTALEVLKVLEKRAKNDAAAAAADATADAENGESSESTAKKPYRLTPSIYNAILGAQWRANPDSHRIVELYKRMRSNGVRPNPMTYAITELSPDEGFSMMRGHDWNPTTQEMNAFLNDALKSNNFTASKEPAIPLDAVSYAILIDAQVKANHVDEAFELFKEMRDSGIAPDTVVYTTLLDACARSHDYARARMLFDGMLASDASVRPNIYSYNVILGMLARKGDLTEAQQLIDTMPTHGNMKGAWQVYEKMCEQSITPDTQTFASLMELGVASFTNLAGHQRQHQYQNRIIAPMSAQLMQLYLEANQAAKAQAIWQQLRDHHITPNQHCIAAVLQACIQQGHLSTAHTIWKQLGDEEVELRDRALTAYANVLLVEERWDDMLNVFKLMENIPSDDTLVPFLDKLRDAGRVEEANELLRSSRSTTSSNSDNDATDYTREMHPRSRTQKDRQPYRRNNSGSHNSNNNYRHHHER
ncbi:hypothetical protein BDF22DRAFT_701855 [Syncephalis plumigaleata]|nr:hypothetical protein BDF22DRAFT_701855 [Syncephalis plumigaleata]